jgi:Uma2 family endonuclease
MARASTSRAKETSKAKDRGDVWTYQEYLELPEDGKRYEILKGRLAMTPAPSTKHQDVSRNLGSILWNFVKKHGLGKVYFAPVDVIFDQVNVVQPDLIYISKERKELIKDAGIFGAPDLIIEIQSPGTLHVDAKRKKEIYERFGVREYWIVDPSEKKAEIFILKGGGYILEGIYTESDTIKCKTIRELSVSLAEVFS